MYDRYADIDELADDDLDEYESDFDDYEFGDYDGDCTSFLDDEDGYEFLYEDGDPFLEPLPASRTVT